MVGTYQQYLVMLGLVGILSPVAYGQVTLPSSGLGGVYYDARDESVNLKTMDKEFSGDVVLIGGGTLLAADRVVLNETTQRINAMGHIVVMTQDQVFTGEHVEYAMDTGDFQIKDAIMVTGDKEQMDEISGRILGFTSGEASFEVARKKRLKEILERKQSLRLSARKDLQESGELAERLVEDYMLLLEQESLVEKQTNPALGRLTEKDRGRLLARRRYWQSTRTLAPAQSRLGDYYFRIEADYLERTNDNDFYAADAFITSCKCEDDEKPAWGFQTDEATAQMGGYADLYHPVLTIKGIPVLYLPYLKLPIKGVRQSGFLLPTVGFEARSGNIISQPIYFAISDHSDATLTTDIFENRGTRLGVEYRFQQSEHSGWEIMAEGMRDRLWMRERGLRSDLYAMYMNGLDSVSDKVIEQGADARSGAIEDAFSEEKLTDRERRARILSDADYWYQERGKKSGELIISDVDAAREDVREHLAVPANSWRSAYKWQGVTFFAPRLSLVSKGEVQSDHRYGEELSILENFDTSYYGNQRANAYSAARARLHLDAEDFYAGIGMRYGDNQLTDSQYEGQQIPAHFRLRTKYYSLFPSGAPVPVYVGARLDNIRIDQFSSDQDQFDTDDSEPTNLGDGNWRRFLVDTVSPLTTDQVVQVSHFTELEARYIDHSGLDDPNSEIRSWRTGLSFVLPLDGKSQLPDALQSDEDLLNGPRTLHHFMDWELEMSLRPSVVKRGPYTNPSFPEVDEFAYFSSDVPRAVEPSLDDGTSVESRMRPHRILKLSTNQWWSTYRDGWRKVRGRKGKGQAQEEETTREQARRELMYSLDRPVAGVTDMFTQDGEGLLVDRYEKTKVDVRTPVTFEAQISYDFLAAESREEQRDHNREYQPEVDDALARVEAKQAEIDQLDEEIPDSGDDRIEKTSRRTALEKELKSLKSALKKARGNILTLDEPLDGPEAKLGLNYENWSLGTSVDYNVYKRANETASFSLTPPSLWDTKVTFGYVLTKELYEDRSFLLTRTRSMKVSTQVIDDWTLGLDLRRRVPEGENKDVSHTATFGSRYDLVYTSPSDCWGVKFSRVKDYAKDEAEASYLLQLTVIFFGQTRGLPDMSGSLLNERDENG